MTLLRVDDLEVSHGPLQALWGVSLAISAGEKVGLLGANGAGKSTTLGAIVGHYPAQAGRIAFDGRDETRSDVNSRLARGMALDARNTDWVEAARAMGNPPWRIGLVHVLPNILPPLLVQATLAIAEAIIAEASLSFLGLGQQPPNPSWGSMLNSAQRFIESAPWLAIFPGLAIFLVVLAFNLVGDGLRDALDPRSQKR